MWRFRSPRRWHSSDDPVKRSPPDRSSSSAIPRRAIRTSRPSATRRRKCQASPGTSAENLRARIKASRHPPRIQKRASGTVLVRPLHRSCDRQPRKPARLAVILSGPDDAYKLYAQTWRICRSRGARDRLRLRTRVNGSTQARDSSASRGHSSAPAPGAWSRDGGTSTIARPPT